MSLQGSRNNVTDFEMQDCTREVQVPENISSIAPIILYCDCQVAQEYGSFLPMRHGPGFRLIGKDQITRTSIFQRDLIGLLRSLIRNGKKLPADFPGYSAVMSNSRQNPSSGKRNPINMYSN